MLASEAGVPVNTQLLKHPHAHIGADIVEEAARWGADLIVMGTHGRHGLERLMQGSHAEHVVRHTSVPVLSLRM